MPHVITGLVLIGKFAIAFTYNAIYIISAELYPTMIRNTSVALAQSFGRLGSIIAPSIQLLVRTNKINV
jgi:OCT family organic cation transporter-like MFS transporter 4/5